MVMTRINVPLIELITDTRVSYLILALVKRDLSSCEFIVRLADNKMSRALFLRLFIEH